jgi:hypothetical protein
MGLCRQEEVFVNSWRAYVGILIYKRDKLDLIYRWKKRAGGK